MFLFVAFASPAHGQQWGEIADGALLLHGGQVLRGDIRRENDRYVVRLEGGREMRLPPSRVEMAAQTIEQIYQHRLQFMDQNSIEQQLEIADWCIHEGLFDKGARHVADVLRVDPNHPQALVFKRRILDALRPVPQPPAEPQPDVQRATYEAPLPPTGEETPPLVELPPGTVRMFTGSVQPLLVNRCAAAHCHGGEESEYRLTRPLSGYSLAAGLTQKNLRETLRWIDAEQPEESPLLKIPQQPHGGMQTPVFGLQDRQQLEKLQEWIRLAVARDPEVAPPSRPAAPVPPPVENDLNQPAGVTAESWKKFLQERGAVPLIDPEDGTEKMAPGAVPSQAGVISLQREDRPPLPVEVEVPERLSPEIIRSARQLPGSRSPSQRPILGMGPPPREYPSPPDMATGEQPPSRPSGVRWADPNRREAVVPASSGYQEPQPPIEPSDPQAPVDLRSLIPAGGLKQ